MGESDNRQCLNRLMTLSSEVERLDYHVVAAEVDHRLDCTNRCNCRSHLACSWLAADLAAVLARRYR